jgi:hypothetical protein
MTMAVYLFADIEVTDTTAYAEYGDYYVKREPCVWVVPTAARRKPASDKHKRGLAL